MLGAIGLLVAIGGWWLLKTAPSTVPQGPVTASVKSTEASSSQPPSINVRQIPSNVPAGPMDLGPPLDPDDDAAGQMESAPTQPVDIGEPLNPDDEASHSSDHQPPQSIGPPMDPEAPVESVDQSDQPVQSIGPPMDPDAEMPVQAESNEPPQNIGEPMTVEMGEEENSETE